MDKGRNTRLRSPPHRQHPYAHRAIGGYEHAFLRASRTHHHPLLRAEGACAAWGLEQKKGMVKKGTQAGMLCVRLRWNMESRVGPVPAGPPAPLHRHGAESACAALGLGTKEGCGEKGRAEGHAMREARVEWNTVAIG